MAKEAQKVDYICLQAIEEAIFFYRHHHFKNICYVHDNIIETQSNQIKCSKEYKDVEKAAQLVPRLDYGKMTANELQNQKKYQDFLNLLNRKKLFNGDGINNFYAMVYCVKQDY